MTAVAAPPPVGRPRRVRLPAITDTTLPNGLRVLIARRPGIPRFECRLLVPVTRSSGRDEGRWPLLSATLMSGTADLSSREIAERLQGMGAGLSADDDADHFVMSGSCLSSHRVGFIDLLGSIVQSPAFPADEVAIERERVVQAISLARSQAATVATDALARRMWGRHPYGRGTPDPAAVEAATPAGLRRLHASAVGPGGGVLVLVGDLPPAATVDDVRAALGGWSPASPPSVPTPPTLLWHRPLLLDRADAVQTTIRIGGAAAGRGDPAWPALAVANTLFGGYFTSRVNQNLREVKGWTYGAQSRVAHHPLASDWMIGTDVGREFTAAALVEIAYELGRMVTQPVSQEEVDSARRYVQGTLAMGIQTQAGLAGQLASLAMVGMDVSYVQTFPAALEKVTVGDVVEAARRFLAPAGLTTVLVGDATVVEPAISPLMDIDRA